MKLIYVIETVQEYITVSSKVRGPDDSRPMLTGNLEVMSAEQVEDDPSSHRVELTSDPHYRFSMPFRDYVVAISEAAGIKLMAQGSIPN